MSDEKELDVFYLVDGPYDGKLVKVDIPSRWIRVFGYGGEEQYRADWRTRPLVAHWDPRREEGGDPTTN